MTKFAFLEPLEVLEHVVQLVWVQDAMYFWVNNFFAFSRYLNTQNTVYSKMAKNIMLVYR